MLVEFVKNSFCWGSVVMVIEMLGCDIVIYRILIIWVYVWDEISVDIYYIVCYKKVMLCNDRDIFY